ncbi:phosphohydrolase [Paenibacillus naphthalenovorans]|uniref:metallophosphoesterase family protein n=1 Tax=Paenibacillus naphthalenovorans TaxID=162209 RepID=UPI0010B19B1C|nr:metallophosphoesterase [Paenibacillus naphthalenovorans]GCL71721.1 phosphohydrolase [Paenibacillus naphthalenovorans]
MMSRRLFVKQMLAILTLMSGGALTASQIWNGASDTYTETKSGGNHSQQPEARTASSDLSVPVLSFFLLSDLHISAADSVFDGRLHLALKDISKFESDVDTIVLGGDLTDFGRESEYKRLQSILHEYKLPPLYGNMGNHDYYDIWLNAKGAFSTETMPNGKTDAMSRERFMRFIGYKDKPYHEVWIKGVHLIMLSQETYVQETPEVGEGAWYSDEQLAWFEETMKAHKDGRPAFVFIHQPLPEPGTDGGTHRLIRAKRFRAILEPYINVFVLSGHSHRNFVGEDHYNRQNTFHWFNNAAVGKTRPVPGQSGTPVQGMYVQVYPHEVVIRGREFSTRTWIEEAHWKVPLLPGKST